MLWLVHKDGRSALLMLFSRRGEIRAADGKLTLSYAGESPQTATYRFLGGIREGNVSVTDSQQRTWTWEPFDPGAHNVRTEAPITGSCTD